MPAPAPIVGRNPDVVQESQLPAKKGAPSAGKKTGTDALKINVNTGGTQGGGTGGLNV